MVRDDLKDTGYDKEAEYFKKQELEAIQRMKEKKLREEEGC